MIDETQMPIAAEHAFKEKKQNYWSFYPSEPFKNGHFNVRYPVKENKLTVELFDEKPSEN